VVEVITPDDPMAMGERNSLPCAPSAWLLPTPSPRWSSGSAQAPGRFRSPLGVSAREVLQRDVPSMMAFW
jgi:hypothetical protein